MELNPAWGKVIEALEHHDGIAHGWDTAGTWSFRLGLCGCEASELVAGFPGLWRLEAFGQAPGGVDRPTVSVWTCESERGIAVCRDEGDQGVGAHVSVFASAAMFAVQRASLLASDAWREGVVREQAWRIGAPDEDH